MHRYPTTMRSAPNRTVATPWAHAELACLALTLEMPFIDDANAPQPEGWSPERSKALGASLVDALATMVGDL